MVLSIQEITCYVCVGVYDINISICIYIYIYIHTYIYIYVYMLSTSEMLYTSRPVDKAPSRSLIRP